MNVVPIEANSPKLLIIDDDEGVSDLIESISKEMNFAVNCVYDFDSIGCTYRNFQPDIIFLDLMLPGYDGVEVLHFLAEAGCKAKIILISGVDKTTLASAGEVGRLHHLNIVGTLKKPFLIEDVEKALLDEADTSCRFTSAAFQDLFGAGEFRILFQPCMAIKSLAGQGVSDVDVCVNWYGQAGTSFITPRQYMPRLETAAMVSEYGHAVLEMSMKAYKNWLQQGLDFGLSIRLDDLLFRDSSLPSYVMNLTKKWGLAPGRITIGISESEVLSGDTTVLDVLTRLRINGFNISAAVSNPETPELERLLHLPVNELRLSKSLISNVPGKVEAEFNVSTLISMCTKQGLLTRAEGVDNEATFEFIYGCGCTSGLGEFFADPLKNYELEGFISKGDYEFSSTAYC
ncbi:MAG: EAL domain-containing protein [Pseudomonadales bacterium]|nr:EAL domain-containing protein [Pseudomonadales bacterium]